MKTFSMTDIGRRKREVNQDYVFATDETIGNLPNLLVVADGMGGHRAGDFASRVYRGGFWPKRYRTCKETHPETILGNSIQAANERLLEEAEKDNRLEGMGTTLGCCHDNGSCTLFCKCRRQQTLSDQQGDPTAFQRPFHGGRDG